MSSLHVLSFLETLFSSIHLEVPLYRFQINVLLGPVPGITMLEGVPEVFFPVMWFENRAGVPESLVFKMKLLSNLPEILSGIGFTEVDDCFTFLFYLYLSLSHQIGVFSSLIIIFGMLALTRRKSGDRSPILNRSLEEERDEDVFLEKEEE